MGDEIKVALEEKAIVRERSFKNHSTYECMSISNPGNIIYRILRDTEIFLDIFLQWFTSIRLQHQRVI